MTPLRIGFVSTAYIGRKNWKATFSSGNAVVSAVASRDEQRSRSFIAECQAACPFEVPPRAFGSYEAMIDSPDVDAIYLSLPTGLRRDLVLRAARNGKHILCEKPCAGSLDDLEQMLAACESHSVQFLDGVMFMHSLRLPEVRAVLDSGTLGPLRRMASGFSFFAGDRFFTENIRVDPALEPLGSLGDLGWYSIRFALWATGWQLPRQVEARILAATSTSDGAKPVPTDFSAEMRFDAGLSVEFYSSFHAAKQQWMIVGGRDGWLRMHDFVQPTDTYEPAYVVQDQLRRTACPEPVPESADRTLAGHANAQDTRMVRAFAAQALSGTVNREWFMWARETQRVVDACLKAGLAGTVVDL